MSRGIGVMVRDTDDAGTRLAYFNDMEVVPQKDDFLELGHDGIVYRVLQRVFKKHSDRLPLTATLYVRPA